MSTVVMGQCWPLQMPPTAKAVLLSLADQANDDWMCWPAIGTICKRTCLSERAVQRAIAWLVQSGVMTINRLPGRSTNYLINPAGFTGTADMFAAPGASARHPRRRDATAGKPPAPVAAAPTPAHLAPRTVINHQEPKKKKFDAGAIELPEWLDASLWARWVKDRRIRGKPITEDGAALQMTELERLRADGFSPEEVIKNSISGGYQGLFPPKRKPGDPASSAAGPWWSTKGGVETMAKTFGWPGWDGVELFDEYRKRVRAHAGEPEEAEA